MAPSKILSLKDIAVSLMSTVLNPKLFNFSIVLFQKPMSIFLVPPTSSRSISLIVRVTKALFPTCWLMNWSAIASAYLGALKKLISSG